MHENNAQKHIYTVCFWLSNSQQLVCVENVRHTTGVTKLDIDSYKSKTDDFFFVFIYTYLDISTGNALKVLSAQLQRHSKRGMQTQHELFFLLY